MNKELFEQTIDINSQILYIPGQFWGTVTSLLALILKPPDSDTRREDDGFPCSTTAVPCPGTKRGDLC